MRALVVFESIFGNTEVIARAIAEGLAIAAVRRRRARRSRWSRWAPPPTTIPAGVDLLVVGGPTHAHGMTQAGVAGDPRDAEGAATRDLERDRDPRVGGGAAGRLRDGVTAAAFDTPHQGARPALGQSAAKGGRASSSAGTGSGSCRAPESFLVDGPTGPLFDCSWRGEADRARGWGASLAAKAGHRRGR